MQLHLILYLLSIDIYALIYFVTFLAFCTFFSVRPLDHWLLSFNSIKKKIRVNILFAILLQPQTSVKWKFSHHNISIQCYIFLYSFCLSHFLIKYIETYQVFRKE